MEYLEKILDFKPTGIEVGRGKVLLSEPFLDDFFFKRSVLLIAEHNEEGSFGLVLNKKTEYKLNEVALDFPDFDADIYIGGPVNSENLFFLHTRGDIIPDSLEILKGVFWGGDIEHIKMLITEEQISPSEIRFFLGYSGWEGNQLADELQSKSWVVASMFARDVFQQDPSILWKKMIAGFGNKFKPWLNFPINPQMN